MSVRRDDSAAVAGKDIDQARAALREANARVAASRETARARQAQVDVAQSQAAEASGGKREVAIRVDQLSPAVPTSARIQDVFFQRGEWVAANQPVVSLIPDNKVKVRFFVPQAAVARYRPGKSVRFSCDGCPAGLSAEIRYVSPKPEFTPPVIFSRDSRDKLVFMPVRNRCRTDSSRADRRLPGSDRRRPGADRFRCSRSRSVEGDAACRDRSGPTGGGDLGRRGWRRQSDGCRQACCLPARLGRKAG